MSSPGLSKRGVDSAQRKASLDKAFEEFRRRSFDGWRSRPLDISFILDQLDTIEDQIPELKGKIDCEKVGQVGIRLVHILRRFLLAPLLVARLNIRIIDPGRFF